MTDTLSPDRQLDIAIARALGPEWMTVSYGGEPRSKGAFSTDPVAFEALMQEIGRRGLGPAYIERLLLLQLGFPVAQHVHHAEIFRFVVSAKQDIRAAAALAVLTEGTNG